MKQTPRKRATHGFTLIEAIIALFFISFIVGEVALVSVLATRSNAYAQRLSQANKIAEALIEKCRNKSFVGLDDPFSAANAPQDPLEVDEVLSETSTVTKQYNECCTPPFTLPCAAAGPLALGGTRTCTLNTVLFKVDRTVSYWSYNNAVPPAAVAALDGVALWADIGVTVSWTDSRQATNQIQMMTRISSR